ncbi:MAG: ABC transporter permease [Candidatus Geothermarchaeales archaeon]
MKKPSASSLIAKGLRWISRKNVEWFMALIGAAMVAAVVAITLLAPFIAPYDPLERNVGKQFEEPSAQFMMGTDIHGRDVYSRMLHGSRTVMLVASVSMTISMLIGIPLGLLSGYSGGAIDRLLSLIMDSVYAFPGLILAIAIAAMLGPGVINMSVAIAIVYIPTYFRMVRGQSLSIKENLYVEAARSIGAKGRTIIFRYIFPNIIPSIVVLISVNIADAILTEAGLTFLGLGISAPTPDWGFDLHMGQPYLPAGKWWLITFPGLMIILVVVGFSLLGEGLNEILNPKLRER